MDKYSGKVNGIEWETTFSKRVRFKCQHCGYCCIASDVALFKNDIERMKKAGVDSTEVSNRGFRIRGSDFNECPFHKKGCEIYSIRPLICREYPFKVTFVSKNRAYIDLLYSCPSIIKREFGLENNVDFAELVKNRSVNSEVSFDLKNPIEKIERDLNKWKNKIGELNQLKDLLDLFSTLAPEENVDFRFFIKKFSKIYKDYLKRNPPYQSIDLSTNNLWLIDEKLMKQIDLNKIKRKKMESQSKEIFNDYLKNFWNRKTTVLDFYSGLNHLKEMGLDISVDELLMEVRKRIILPLQFFSLVVSEKNKNKSITEKDAKETIFALDCSLFTPMDSIVPGVLKRTRFFD